jgi:acetyltransferase-like isoleucine patch superfamily enzyme
LEGLRKAARLIRYGWRAARSALLLLGYRCLYSGLRVGRNVRLGRGVYVNVASGGRLVIGDNVFIGPNAHLTADGGTIEIGSDCFVGDGVVIVSAEHVAIGRDALIAAYATIRDQDHGMADADRPYRLQPLQTSPIEIGDNVWLGAHVVVLKGAVIGPGCVVGANAVVTGPLPAATLCVGSPAKVLRPVRGGDGPDLAP